MTKTVGSESGINEFGPRKENWQGKLASEWGCRHSKQNMSK